MVTLDEVRFVDIVAISVKQDLWATDDVAQEEVRPQATNVSIELVLLADGSTQSVQDDVSRYLLDKRAKVRKCFEIFAANQKILTWSEVWSTNVVMVSHINFKQA